MEDPIYLQQLRCNQECTNYCESENKNNINSINDCKVKKCNCDLLKIISSNESHLTSMIIDILIILSFISLTISIIVIFVTFNRRNEISEDKSNYSILNELSDIEKSGESKIFDSEYDIMTTKIESYDMKENNIRDF